MTLGDLGNSLNKSGKDLYGSQRGRILQEGKQSEEREKAIEAQRVNTEISHLRLHKQTLDGRILHLETEMRREKNPQRKFDLEKEFHKLRNDRLHLEGEIQTMQGRDHAAHNIRFNNPHYF